MSKLFLGTEEITPTDTKLITTYTGGNGIIVAKDTINIDQSVVALKAELPKNVSQLANDKGYLTNADLTEKFDAKQNKLTAGDNIAISEDNVISATDTTYTAGVGISIENGVISNTQTSAEWGNITGTLSEQTDLKNVLDTKVDKSNLSTVATSGSYDDLINKPTIPTDTNDLTNGAGFVTSSDLDGYATETWVDQQGYITGITNEDITTALGYTPYDNSNPNGYTSNIGTVTAVNDILPDQNGNVNISVPSIIIRDWSTNNNE